jgi:ligand-binding SRPBCC domain-containing protein
VRLAFRRASPLHPLIAIFFDIGDIFSVRRRVFPDIGIGRVPIIMGIEYESVVDHPIAEVFAWHTRPGAMTRLVPPWQPMKVVAETQSLAGGRAVLSLPGGLRWVAQHDPSAFDPPHRFVDVLSSEGPMSWPARVIGWWRHTHEFSEVSSGTRVCDHVDASVPAPDFRLPPSPARRRSGRTP